MVELFAFQGCCSCWGLDENGWGGLLGAPGLLSLNRGLDGGKFWRSFGGRRVPVTAKWRNWRTRSGACTHHGRMMGFKTDLGSSRGNGHTMPSMRNMDASTVVSRNSLVTLGDDLAMAVVPENANEQIFDNVGMSSKTSFHHLDGNHRLDGQEWQIFAGFFRNSQYYATSLVFFSA